MLFIYSKLCFVTVDLALKNEWSIGTLYTVDSLETIEGRIFARLIHGASTSTFLFLWPVFVPDFEYFHANLPVTPNNYINTN